MRFPAFQASRTLIPLCPSSWILVSFTDIGASTPRNHASRFPIIHYNKGTLKKQVAALSPLAPGVEPG
jgi:hypothetical protein